MLGIREQTYAKVDHPDPLVTTDGKRLERIDDPVAAALQTGDTLLGWIGDPRLCLYLDVEARMWELWRLEADGVYRRTTSIPADVMRGPEVVARLIDMLLTCDRNRGFDVGSTLVKHEVARQAKLEAEQTALNEEFAGRLQHALHKDGVY